MESKLKLQMTKLNNQTPTQQRQSKDSPDNLDRKRLRHKTQSHTSIPHTESAHHNNGANSKNKATIGCVYEA